MSIVNIDLAKQTILVTGALHYDNVLEARELGIQFINKLSNIIVDLTGVSHSDSSSLALLTSWCRYAHQQDKPIRFIHFPQQLIDIARVSDLDNILGAEGSSLGQL